MQIDSDAPDAASNRGNGPASLTPAEALPAIPNSPANFLFTSESVGEGHPDKIADQVSDAILDACLTQDPMSKVACETAVMTGLVLVFGEISTRAQLDYSQIVRETIRRIGYDDSSKGKISL